MRAKVWWCPNNVSEPIEVEILDGLLVGEVAGHISGTIVSYWYLSKEAAMRAMMHFHRASHLLYKASLEQHQKEVARAEHNEALRGMEECDRMHAGLWR